MTLPVYLITASLLLIGAYVTFRIIVRRDYQRRGKLTSLSSALETSVFFLWGVFTWIDLPPGWTPQDIHPIVNFIAWSMIIAGLTLLTIIIAWFGLRRAFGQEVNALKYSGFYRYSRNPQIMVCGMAVVGYALLWPSWHTLGWVILYVVISHMMVLTEEEHLRKTFGEEYAQYCSRVPRYLGLRRRCE